MKKTKLTLLLAGLITLGFMGCKPTLIASHDHTYSKTWSKDTTHHWHAATCGCTDEVKDRAEHEYGDWSKGKKSCTTCGYEVVCQHSFGEWSTTKEASETEGGKMVRLCTVCNFEEEKNTPNLNHEHNWSDKWSKNETNHWKTCSGCSEENESVAHTFGAWSDGKKSCTTCGYEVNCQHTVGEWSTDATNHWKVCSVCGKKVEEAVHSYDWVTTDATNHWKVCSECGKKVEKATHSFVHKGNGWKRCSACDRESTTPVSLETLGTYNSTKMTFGVYPQTIKASTVTVDKSVKNTEITGAAYYLGSDGAWYAECIENGCATGSDSKNSQYQYSDGSYVSVKNKGSPKTLYFKVEPVEWVKLSTTGCLVATKILTANVAYYPYSEVDRTIGSAKVYPNNYQHSRVRAFLNGLSYGAKSSSSGTLTSNIDFQGKGFLQSAFTSTQQKKIKTTTVDNSVASTCFPYNRNVCGNTSDKVFLLSRKEAYDNGLSSSDRIRKPTDYAFANYCGKNSDSTYGCFWWLRSPEGNDTEFARDGISEYTEFARYMDYRGYDLSCYTCVDDTYLGVVPALSISE